MRKFVYLIAALGIFFLDLATKLWARESLRFGDAITVINDFLNFNYAENTGVAFSQLNDGGETGRWALTALAVFAALVVLYYLWRTPPDDRLQLSVCALLLEGILGNAVNRALADTIRLLEII